MDVTKSDQAGPAANPSNAVAVLCLRLEAIVGAEHVLTEAGQRLFFATDIFTSGRPVAAVVAPANTAELSAVAALCSELGVPMTPRGGGFSYTKGYVPLVENSVSIDLRRMDAVRTIDLVDMYVEVEVGCTWARLYEALKTKGVRTPYFGPMSGYRATVGGALSQGSFFLGSTQYGTTADTVLGLEVVLADGSVVRTGSAGGTNTSSPFFRNYGPDLTGLFLHDSGALAFKATAMLKLIPFPQHHRYATFAFEANAAAAALETMSAIARAGLAAECYLWDPGFAAKMSVNNRLVDDLRYFSGVVKSGKGLLGGLVDGMKLAKAGKKFLASNRYLLHVTFDDVTDAGAQGRMDEAFRIASEHGGEAIEPSIPRALRAMPFNDFTAITFADQTQRNLPTHGIFPHSCIAAVSAAVAAFLDTHSARLAANGITVGTIYFAVGPYAVACEPLFYWQDPQLAAHDRQAERSDLDRLATMPERPAAGQAVAELRAELTALFSKLGAVHLQIGKSYPYRETREPEVLALVERIKTAVDPQHLVNPGSLGLD